MQDDTVSQRCRMARCDRTGPWCGNYEGGPWYSGPLNGIIGDSPWIGVEVATPEHASRARLPATMYECKESKRSLMHP